MDIFLLIGLVSLGVMVLMFMISDFEIPLGKELHISIQGVLLGSTFLSFTSYYIQNFIPNKILLSISAIMFFCLGYYIFLVLIKFLRAGETGDVLTIENLLYKKGNIINFFEKNGEYFYEVMIENQTFITKALKELDREVPIVVAEIDNEKNVIIVNI